DNRITTKQVISALVRSMPFMDLDLQIMLCAAAPDTSESAEEMKSAVDKARTKRSDIVWIDEKVDRKTATELYSHAAVFCCPSVYETFGIINMEAFVCDTTVVEGVVGGLSDVVVDR